MGNIDLGSNLGVDPPTTSLCCTPRSQMVVASPSDRHRATGRRPPVGGRAGSQAGVRGQVGTKGRQHEGELNRASAWPGFDALLELARQSSDQLVAIAEALVEDSEVALPYRGKAYRYPTSFFLAHAAGHGVEHRTEIKVGLAQQGIETPDLDAWYYGGAAGYGQEVPSMP